VPEFAGTLTRILRRTWPTWRIVSSLVDEQIHHDAEISLLRDVYPPRR
jgi:hypothetical protein